MKTKMLKLLFVMSVFLSFLTRPAMSADRGFDEALAQFLEGVYLNTETVTNSDKFCLYGSDGITIYLLGKNDTVVLDDVSGDKSKYKKCRIIYVAKNKEKLVKSFVESMNKSGALTISTFPNFVSDGGMLFVDVGRRNFELTVNVMSFKKSGVKIDSSITGLIINKN